MVRGPTYLVAAILSETVLNSARLCNILKSYKLRTESEHSCGRNEKRSKTREQETVRTSKNCVNVSRVQTASVHCWTSAPTGRIWRDELSSSGSRCAGGTVQKAGCASTARGAHWSFGSELCWNASHRNRTTQWESEAKVQDTTEVVRTPATASV